jgi:transcriptional regulator with XRE-family HTH domain
MQYIIAMCDMEFARILKDIMAKRGLTQLALSNMIGMRQSQIHNWLYGRNFPNYFSLKLLSEKLHIDIAEFFYN